MGSKFIIHVFSVEFHDPAERRAVKRYGSRCCFVHVAGLHVSHSGVLLLPRTLDTSIVTSPGLARKALSGKRPTNPLRNSSGACVWKAKRLVKMSLWARDKNTPRSAISIFFSQQTRAYGSSKSLFNDPALLEPTLSKWWFAGPTIGP